MKYLKRIILCVAILPLPLFYFNFATPSTGLNLSQGSLPPFVLNAGEAIYGNGMTLTLQTAGNLVLYNSSGQALWYTSFGGYDCVANSCQAYFQDDGNLDLYENGQPYWSSNSAPVAGNLSRIYFSPQSPYVSVLRADGSQAWTNELATQIFSTSFTALAQQNMYCTSQDGSGTACASATSRFCSAQGFSTGVGPIETNGDSVTVACLTPRAATLMGSSFAALAQQNSGCNANAASSSPCFSAVSRECSAMGFSGGLKVVESDGTNALFICLNTGASDTYSVPWPELSLSSGDCNSSNADHCSTASARYCSSLGTGFTSGFGVKEWAPLSGALTCLRDHIGQPEAIDVLKYFMPAQTLGKNGPDYPFTDFVDQAAQRLYRVKFNNPTDLEIYDWDQNQIYFSADTSGDPQQQTMYSFKNQWGGRQAWAYRQMLVGSGIELDDNIMSIQDRTSCASQDSPFPYMNQLRAHIPRFQLGGDGDYNVVDAIVITYNYFGASRDIFGQERFYYARTLPDANGNSRALGWVKYTSFDHYGQDPKFGSDVNFPANASTTVSWTRDNAQTQPPETTRNCGH